MYTHSAYASCFKRVLTHSPMPKTMKNSNKSVKSTKAKSVKSTKVRPKVQCHCKKCNGKFVETRTRNRHEMEEKRLQAALSKEKVSDQVPANSKKHSRPVPIEIQPIVADSSQNIRDDDIEMIDTNHDRSGEEFFTSEHIEIRKKRRRYDRYQKTCDHTIINPDEEPEQESSSSDEEGSHLSDDDYPAVDDEELIFDEDEVPVELFTTPNLNYDSDQEYPNMKMNTSDSWILLWIFKYQERFKLPDVAINSLIGFFSLVLKDVDSNRFENFPSTAYMARKLLKIKKNSKSFATCPDCNKLYDITAIIPVNSGNGANTGFKCTHIEFPNHPKQNQRKPCGSELLMKVPVNNGYIWRPK